MKKKIFVLCLILLINLIFVDVVGAVTYNNYVSSTVSCGENMLTKIPGILPQITSLLYMAFQILVPVLLVIFGSVDLFKGITAGKEDDIKKGQQMFIKRLISGVLVFLVFMIVKLFISLLAGDPVKYGTITSKIQKSDRIMMCAECFIENNDNCVKEE